MVRLKASSLLEATVALSLITVVLGIGWLTVEQLLTNDDTAQSFHAQLLMEQRAQQIIQTRDWEEGLWDTLGYQIEQRLVPLAENPDYVWLRLFCKTPGNKTFEHQLLTRYE